ncbi:MAG: glycoside hydrolase family 97 protein, partial [Bacteroidales bacterium]|nr:glycoside hydrolase family 97 protein [Bacteroidales bacterium]
PLYKKASISLAYTQMRITFQGNWGVIFRAYDTGVAYRFFTTRKGELVIMDEVAQFQFSDDHPVLAAYTVPRLDDRFSGAYQSIYTSTTLGALDTSKTVLLPTLITLPKKRVVITEVDLEHYPGMFFEKSSQGYGLSTLFPKYPKEVIYHPTRKQERVTASEPYMAIVNGTREFPWRLMVISEDDASLLLSDLVYALAPPPDPKLYPITLSNDARTAPQISWIKPGKVAWDWWNDWRIYGVDFVAGINTQTYKYYIDFAADNGLEYVILDEGWSPPPTGDVMKIIPQIDLPELIRYADSKNVGLILWVVWNVLDEKLEEACAHYAQMGIKGFKIDFIDRADQKAIEFVPRASLMAAKYKLFVDFHGVSKPTGQNRTYPNALTFEGVYGLEELKWANPDMPLYDVTWPFIRGLAGPADYTQGAMKNAARDAFASIYREPMSQGTRCHQMGSYMIFESPLAMLCDNPSNYKKEQECTDFISKIPTTYDETVVVAAQVGEYIVMARRQGNDWYIGGITNWTPRDLTLDLSFLPQGTYRAELFTDGVNAHRVGIDYKRSQFNLTPGAFNLHMAPGGGFAMRLSLP